MTRNPRAAIFDMDGTLLDSMPIYDTAVADMLLKLGYTPRDEWRAATRPLSGMEVLEYVRREYDTTETAEELEAALDRELYGYYASTPQLKPGVLPVLEELERRGVPMCVCTATNRVHVEAALKRTGIARFFRRIFTCAEENTGKRETKIFLTAAAFMNAEPCDTYVFEDAIHAVRSAKRAGFYVVAVRDLAEDGNRAEIMSLADEFYDDLTDFSW